MKISLLKSIADYFNIFSDELQRSGSTSTQFANQDISTLYRGVTPLEKAQIINYTDKNRYYRFVLSTITVASKLQRTALNPWQQGGTDYK
jgi:hypothetical protein